MADRVTLKLNGELARHRAQQLVWQAPSGYIAMIGEETRSEAQNRLMWPLIKDVRLQVPGFDQYDPDQTKLRFLNALAGEGKFLPTLDGKGMFPIGQRSSALSKSQFTALIELIFAFGAERGVKWSHRSLNTMSEMEAA